MVKPPESVCVRNPAAVEYEPTRAVRLIWVGVQGPCGASYRWVLWNTEYTYSQDKNTAGGWSNVPCQGHTLASFSSGSWHVLWESPHWNLSSEKLSGIHIVFNPFYNSQHSSPCQSSMHRIGVVGLGA